MPVRIIIILFIMTSTSSHADPAINRFSGKWNTSRGILLIAINDNSATGAYYGKYSGTLKGKLEKNRLFFRWKDMNGEYGRGYFIISPDGKSIVGKYGTCDSDSSEGDWSGVRIEEPDEAGKAAGEILEE
ncbi:MAG: hypothetical protein MUD12_10335 [Spirochaetes bacterium]|jgi:hypothetical protein|nr:hypothetical protein [Spirochaetota bacterium]